MSGLTLRCPGVFFQRSQKPGSTLSVVFVQFGESHPTGENYPLRLFNYHSPLQRSVDVAEYLSGPFHIGLTVPTCYIGAGFSSITEYGHRADYP